MAKLFANTGNPDQTPRSAASDLGLHYLPVTLLRVSRLQFVRSFDLRLFGFVCFLFQGLRFVIVALPGLFSNPFFLTLIDILSRTSLSTLFTLV